MQGKKIDFLLFFCSLIRIFADGNKDITLWVQYYIHVIHDKCEAKFWLEPVVELAKNTGFSEHELNRIKKLVEKYADRFKEQFRQHVGKRIDD